MTHLKDAAPTYHFQQLYDDHISAGMYFPLGESLQLYLWLRANSFWSVQAESFEHVGYWVRRGLVVSRFTLKDFGAQIGKDSKTVGRWLQRIEECGFGVRLQVGGDLRADGQRTPVVVAVGAWDCYSTGVRTPYHVDWKKVLTGRDGLMTAAELEAHQHKVGGRNMQKGAKLGEGHAQWAALRQDTIIEESCTPGRTDLSQTELDKNVFPRSDKNVPPARTDLSHGYLDSSSLDSKDINTLAELRSARPGEGEVGGLGETEQRKAKSALQGVRVGEPGVGVGGQSEHTPASEVEVGGRRNTAFALEAAVEVDVERESPAAAPQIAARRSTAYARPTPSPAPSRPSGSVQAPTSHEEVPEALVEAPVAKKPRKPSAKVSEGFKYPPGAHKAMVDSIAQVCFPEGGVTKGHWSLIGTKASELLDAGYAAEEIPLIAQFLLEDQFWSQKLTPTVIVSQAPRWRSSGAKRPVAQPARNITPKSAITPEMQARLDAANADEKARTEELIRLGGRK